MSDEFLTLAGDGEAEIRVKGSSFIALAFPVSSEADFRERLLQRSRKYFDATHNCAAWTLREGIWRAIDDGEPGGSAGAPILSAIEAAQLTDSAVIVTRYFGGTKLGVGGLVRAYGEAAEAALASAPRRTGLIGSRLVIRYPYASTSVVMRSLDRFEHFELDHGFTDEGVAEVSFVIPGSRVADFDRLLQEESSGSLTADLRGSFVVYRQG